MPGFLFPPVNPAGVAERKILHAAGKRDIAYLDSQMDMVGHETERMNAVTKSDGAFLKQKVETVAVSVGKEDGLTAVTPKNDVIKPTGQMYAWFACHEAKIPSNLNLSTWKPDPKGGFRILNIWGRRWA